MTISYEEFIEETNLAGEIAKAQLELSQITGLNMQDIREGTVAYDIANMVGNSRYITHNDARYVLNQLSYQAADDYGIMNIWAPNRDILISPGTKTIIQVQLVITKKQTLYSTLPDDNVNNYLAQIQTESGTIFTIQKTETFNPGTYLRLFECDEFGEIYVNEGEVNIITNPLEGWGLDEQGSAINVGSPISVGTPPDSVADVSYKISKTTPIHTPRNLVQGLEKDLINAGCKDSKLLISTNEHNYEEQGLPLNGWLVVCDGGDRNKIFDALEANCFAKWLHGTESKGIVISGQPYTLKFSYAIQVSFYIKIVVQSRPQYIENVVDFITLLTNYLKQQQNINSSIQTIFCSNSEIIGYAQHFFNEQSLKNLYVSSCQLKINESDEWGETVGITDIKSYLFIQNISFIDVEVEGNDL